MACSLPVPIVPIFNSVQTGILVDGVFDATVPRTASLSETEETIIPIAPNTSTGHYTFTLTGSSVGSSLYVLNMFASAAIIAGVEAEADVDAAIAVHVHRTGHTSDLKVVSIPVVLDHGTYHNAVSSSLIIDLSPGSYTVYADITVPAVEFSGDTTATIDVVGVFNYQVLRVQ